MGSNFDKNKKRLPEAELIDHRQNLLLILIILVPDLNILK